MLRSVAIILCSCATVHGAASKASLLGDVGFTTVSCPGTSFGTRSVGENIFGPFENGFTSTQNSILAGLGCATGKGYVQGGIDTATASSVVARDCIGTTGSLKSGLIDSCGGHTSDYHFHESLSCCTSTSGTDGHSGQVGRAATGDGLIYGQWEKTNVLPNLDACGGHWGTTPSSPTTRVYHYHVQTKAPFTIGCFGPNTDNSIVTLAQCRALYTGCSSTAVSLTVQVGTTWPTTSTGTTSYRLWCPCYDAAGSNVGSSPLPCEANPSADGCSYSSSGSPPVATSAPVASPTATKSPTSATSTRSPTSATGTRSPTAKSPTAAASNTCKKGKAPNGQQCPASPPCPTGCAAGTKGDDEVDAPVTAATAANVNGAARAGAFITGLLGPVLLLIARQLC